MTESMRILEYMHEQRPAIVQLTRRLVEIESPTSDKECVDRAVSAVEDEVRGFASVTRYPQPDYGDHLRIEFDIPSRGDGQVLGIGHLDTVWPVGTIQRMQWREADGRLWGPGVFDMKAGVAYLIFAARALRDLGLTCDRRFVVQLNTDEEIGSPASTPHTESEARKSAAVLVAEPSASLDGNLKTARKGGAKFQVQATGVGAHAGLDFASGANAIVELSAQVQRLASWTDLDRGLTVNPGVIRGGTATNVVAERASVDIDVRFATRLQAEEIEAKFQGLRPVDTRCSIKVSGGIRKLPLERTPEVARLFRLARSISTEYGIDLGEASVGGCSDGNTTAAMGVPTLDGLGAVGEGAHAAHESILVSRIADRAALLATLVHRL